MLPRSTINRRLRHLFIHAGLEGLSLAHAAGIYKGKRHRGIIFTLHHVRPDLPGLTPQGRILSITPSFLEQAIQTCLASGMVPLALEDLPERLKDPQDKRVYFCFTLDDGYRNNALFAAPIFRKYQVPYTIFVTEGFVERTRSIWWETIEKLLAEERELKFDFGKGMRRIRTDSARGRVIAYDRFAEFVQEADEDEAVARIDALARENGFDPLALVDDLILREDELADLARDPLARIGAHTLTHVNLRRVNEARLKQELEGSAAAVERYVGYRPLAFAYPYGDAFAAGEREMDAAEAAGYKIAVTTRPGLLSKASLTRPTGFNRVSLNGYYQRQRYVKVLINGIPSW